MPDLNAVFVELRSILAPYAAKLDPKTDDASELYVDTRHIRKPLFFAAVQVRKSFVSFHLMPVYTRPELLEGLSPLRGAVTPNLSLKLLGAIPRSQSSRAVSCHMRLRVYSDALGSGRQP